LPFAEEIKNQKMSTEESDSAIDAPENGFIEGCIMVGDAPSVCV